MKLVKHSDQGSQYHLAQNEAEVLISLIRRFSFTEFKPANISQNDHGPESVEREKLLNESLAAHRNGLKKTAVNLLKFKPAAEGRLLTLDPGSQEALLQILNDIRVGCWRALGEPENADVNPPDPSDKGFAYYNLMNLAGYFEHELLNPAEKEK